MYPKALRSMVNGTHGPDLRTFAHRLTELRDELRRLNDTLEARSGEDDGDLAAAIDRLNDHLDDRTEEREATADLAAAVDRLNDRLDEMETGSEEPTDTEMDDDPDDVAAELTALRKRVAALEETD